MSDKITVGAQVSLYLNGILYGQVTAFKFTSTTTYKEQFGLDSLVPYELTPTTCKVSGGVSVIRIVGSAGLEGAGITTQFEKIDSQKYFDLAIRDNFTDAVLFESSYTVVSNQSWDYPAKGIAIGNFQFTGLSWSSTG